MINTRSKNRIKEGSSAGTAIIYVLSALASIITLYPMYYVLILSLSAPQEAVKMEASLLPRGGVYLESYRILLGDARLWRSYLNTILYVAGNTILMLATSVMAAYPLTYKKLYARRFVTFFLLPCLLFFQISGESEQICQDLVCCFIQISIRIRKCTSVPSQIITPSDVVA